MGLVEPTEIRELSVGLDFSAPITIPVHQEPKPTLILGENGTGKSTCLHSLAYASEGNFWDALQPGVHSIEFGFSGDRTLSLSMDSGGTRDYRQAIEVRACLGAEPIDATLPGGGGYEVADVIVDFYEVAALNSLRVDASGRLVAAGHSETSLERDYVRSIGLERETLEMTMRLLASGDLLDHGTALHYLPERYPRLLQDSPVRVMGTHRLGVIPSRNVRTWREDPRQKPDTAHPNRRSGSIVPPRDDTISFIQAGVANAYGKMTFFNEVEQWLGADPPAASSIFPFDVLVGGEQSDEQVASSDTMDVVDDLSLPHRLGALGKFLGRYFETEQYERVARALCDTDKPAHLSTSTGEQQLLALFYGVLVALPPRCVVLIDEPELSLHVAWQLTLVQDLVEAADMRGSRIVVATHSPAIVNDWWDWVVEPAR